MQNHPTTTVPTVLQCIFTHFTCLDPVSNLLQWKMSDVKCEIYATSVPPRNL